MVMVKSDEKTEAGVMPDTKSLAEMGNFNEALVDAGLMLSGEGLRPSVDGKRVKFSGEKRTVIDGPFPSSDSLVAGFWIWKVASMDEAVEWVKRCPNPTGDASEIEIRPIFETEDFGEAATPEIREQEERLRVRLEERV
jgi:hypothetical protein